MYIRLVKNMFHAPIFGFFYIWVSIFDKLKLISRLSFCQKSRIFALHRSSFDKCLNSFDAYSSLLFASEASYILYVPLAHVSPVWFAQLHLLFLGFSIHKHAILRFWDCLTSSFNKRLKSSSPRAPNAVFLSFSIKCFASSAIFSALLRVQYLYCSCIRSSYVVLQSYRFPFDILRHCHPCFSSKPLSGRRQRYISLLMKT